jgi:hypothetical protein
MSTPPRTPPMPPGQEEDSGAYGSAPDTGGKTVFIPKISTIPTTGRLFSPPQLDRSSTTGLNVPGMSLAAQRRGHSTYTFLLTITEEGDMENRRLIPHPPNCCQPDGTVVSIIQDGFTTSTTTLAPPRGSGQRRVSRRTTTLLASHMIAESLRSLQLCLFKIPRLFPSPNASLLLPTTKVKITLLVGYPGHPLRG